VGALNRRLKLASPLKKALDKVFPDHWTFMLGEVALYSFAVLVLTGTFLALFFDPSTAETTYTGNFTPMAGQSTSAAYAPTLQLSFDVRAGLLMRQTHHWAALVFIAAIVLHLCRIFFTGAYRRPREINWVIGVTMLMLALLNGFTGYSMPDDQLSGIGLRIIYSAVESVPVVGAYLAFLAFGGEFPADQTIPRMFAAHVFIVPILLFGLIGAHLVILIRQKHTHFAGTGRTEHNVVGSRLWPTYTVRTLALFTAALAVLFALGGLVQINPVWIYGPFHPAQATIPSQPDWYVAWGEGALRLFPRLDLHVFGGLIPSPFFPAVALGGVTFLALYAWPFVDQFLRRDHSSHQILDRPRDHPIRMAVGVFALTFFGLLLLAASDDVVADWLELPVNSVVWAYRIIVLVVPPLAAIAAYFLSRAMRRVPGGVSDLTRDDLRSALHKPSGETQQEHHTGGRIDILAVADDQWMWRYIATDRDDDALESTNRYPTKQAAIAAAATAYPAIQSTAPEISAAAPDNDAQPAPKADRSLLLAVGAVVLVAWAVTEVRQRH
jgi:ubiquinol-cytochrome c reductase cytochrome b subunit